ncbi:MAG: peptide chain release factor N(5)-glutamine methyltransferase [Planctomycetes bacterium]|nr:peptide chain release factor N(5)-glutamine methyltransferase [Planctomycetota bacterium]
MNADSKDSKAWAIMPLLNTTAEYLSGKGIASARLDAELLLSHTLKLPRLELYTSFERNLTEPELAAYRELVQRRASREPIAYILGEKEFYSLPFRVTPAVLIPRPETELLAEEAISLCNAISKKSPRILDLGTGSGCIAVAVAHACPHAKIIATDISADAVKIAKENAEKNQVADRIEFRTGSIFEPVASEHFDLVLCNPPYIAENDPEVMADVSKFEPQGALYAGKDGLDFYRSLAAGLEHFLAPKGIAMFEVGAGQTEAVSELFRVAAFPHLLIKKDHAGIGRLLIVSRVGLPVLNSVNQIFITESQELAEPCPVEYDGEPSAEMQAALNKALDTYGEDDPTVKS